MEHEKEEHGKGHQHHHGKGGHEGHGKHCEGAGCHGHHGGPCVMQHEKEGHGEGHHHQRGEGHHHQHHHHHHREGGHEAHCKHGEGGGCQCHGTHGTPPGGRDPTPGARGASSDEHRDARDDSDSEGDDPEFPGIKVKVHAAAREWRKEHNLPKGTKLTDEQRERLHETRKRVRQDFRAAYK